MWPSRPPSSPCSLVSAPLPSLLARAHLSRLWFLEPFTAVRAETRPLPCRRRVCPAPFTGYRIPGPPGRLPLGPESLSALPSS